ncbi:tetratricopeptide repeat protein [Roseateles sp. PN1]|uniref:tetratricopeptide repeat protein n=1 Tax=Roseateles sp. PN1 TaxID=3137372 RepID=UPI00313911AF
MAKLDLACLLLIDIVDSAALSERLGDQQMAQLWLAHDKLARSLLHAWHGREIDKADGFLLFFERAGDALGFALAYHQALAALPEPLLARVGLHAGPVTLRENSPHDVAIGAKPLEVDGLAKPVAARVMAAARGGQTLLSKAARELLGQNEQGLVSHGHWRLKGLPEPLELFEAGTADAPFLPPPDSDKAYRVVQQAGHWQPVRDIRHSLPAERDAFVGRRAPLQELARRFALDARLVSVLGIGGAGKTRLVTHFGWTWRGNYPGGVWFCDLAAARSVDGLASAVAQGLGMRLDKLDPVEQLCRAIAGRGRCLLILDNFEQVARHAEDTLGQWLDRAPDAHFLVTTREVLGIPGEETLALAPLPWPDAENLFWLRAHAARIDFHPSEEDRAAVGALVRLLDGLPLAIELAASRVRILPPRAMLARMSERFKLLASTGGRHDRQSTLRAAFDWSWDLLSPAERATLAQLSVFENGFNLAAAESVIDLSAFADAPWSVDALHSLVDKSFVRAISSERFDLLVSVQAYADEHLRTPGRFAGSGPAALRAAQARHAAWFAALGPDHAKDGNCSDLDNLIVACRRAVHWGDGRVATGALEGTWSALSLHGPFKVGVSLAQSVSQMQSLDDELTARVELVMAQAWNANGRLTDARLHAEAALIRAESIAHTPSIAAASILLAVLLLREGRFERATVSARQALQHAQAIRDSRLECSALNTLGILASNAGQVDESKASYLASLDLARRSGDLHWQASALGNLGALDLAQGHLAQAQEYFEATINVAKQLGDRKCEGNALCNLGFLHHMRQRVEDAIRLSQQALAIAKELGHARLECVVLCNLGIFLTHLEHPRDAIAKLNDAMSMAKDLADRHLEGQVLCYLAAAQLQLAQFDLARNSLALSQPLLQAAEDQAGLGVLLCTQAQCAHLEGRTDDAVRLVSDAKALAHRLQIEAHSEFGATLQRTELMLGRPN